MHFIIPGMSATKTSTSNVMKSLKYRSVYLISLVLPFCFGQLVRLARLPRSLDREVSDECRSDVLVNNSSSQNIHWEPFGCSG